MKNEKVIIMFFNYLLMHVDASQRNYVVDLMMQNDYSFLDAVSVASDRMSYDFFSTHVCRNNSCQDFNYDCGCHQMMYDVYY